MSALFVDELEVARLLRAHLLDPVCLARGGTVWRCKKCNEDFDGRHSEAQASHQARILKEVAGD